MASIWFALNQYAFDDAIFLAERLYSEIGSDENLHLLATCYYRASKPIAAYKILTRKAFKSSECTVLLAKCCCDLKKYDEAEKTLMIKCKKSTGKALLSTEDLITNFNESASFVSQLLGLICSKTERQNRAIEYYKKSLKINPFLWSSFEKLAQFGVKLDSSKIFDINNVDFNMCHGFNPLVNLCSTNDKTIDQLSSLKQNQQQYQSFNTINALDNQMQSNNFNCSNLTQTPSLISMKDLNQAHEIRSPFAFIKSTPEASLIDVITPENWITTACLAPRKSINSTTSSKTIGRNKLPPNLPKKFNPLQIDKSSTMSNNKQNLRRSSRLFNSSSSVKENNTKTTRNMNQENSKKTLQTCSKTPTKRIKMSSNNNSSTSLHKSNNNLDNANYNSTDYQKTNDKTFLITNQSLSSEDLKQANIKMQRASAEGLLNLLSVLGQAALAIGQYKCEQAINILQKLPKKHYQSGYVLTSIGRGYFELGKYEEAVAFFEEARRREPYLLKGMEYYSTALWHLQREVKLSSLAQELIEYDRNAPQTWCVAGNCFSLQKEHETAIKFLQRAIQVDVDFSYAYTLLGHEFVLTEEMDNAMKCFRNAIGIDNRHYNAFYGIGMIYYKQEKFKMAEVHYRKALQISQNPVLLCHLAVVQHALKKSDLALQTLNRAIEMDPKNALCKFHRASIKFSMDDYNSALSELEDLKQIVPKESLVYFLIGKVYKKLGNTHLALMNFSWAMDLDPKGANNQIKEVIDKQYPNEDDDQTINSDPIRNDSTNSTDNSDNSLMRPHLSMSSSSDGIDEDDDN